MTPYGNDTINDSASAFHECLSSVDNYNRGMLRIFRNFRKFEFSGNQLANPYFRGIDIVTRKKNYNH